MKRIKVTNKTKNPKGFHAVNGELTLEPGENFIPEEDLQYLMANSPGFNIFVKDKALVVRDEKRDETEDEKIERLSFKEKAKAFFQKVNPQKLNHAVIPQIPEQDIEALSSGIVEEFKQQVSDAGNEQLKTFQEKSTQLAEQTTAAIQGQVLADLEKNLPDLKEQFKEGLKGLHAEELEAFKTAIGLEKLQLAEDIDELIKEKLEAFGKSLADAHGKAEKEFKKKLQTAKKSG